MLDGAEGIRAGDALLARARGMLTDSLAETAEFISVGCVPHVFVLWVAAELAVFKRLAGVLVQDWEGQVGVVVGLHEGSDNGFVVIIVVIAVIICS